MVNSKEQGSLLSFVNFSHQPNLAMVPVSVHGIPGYVWGLKVCSPTPLTAGTTLSVDYSTSFDEDPKPKECLCASKMCQGYIGHLYFADNHLLSWVMRVKGGYKSIKLQECEHEKQLDTLAYTLLPGVNHITSAKLTAIPDVPIKAFMVLDELIRRKDVFSLNSSLLHTDTVKILSQLFGDEPTWGRRLFGMFEGLLKKTKAGMYAIFSMMIAHDLDSELPSPLSHYKNIQFAFPITEKKFSDGNRFFVHSVSSSLFLFYLCYLLIILPGFGN
jgi:hypothetical protein